MIDITVLMLLIWSFHLQYEQPPAFYLKAPTLLYVFIFIALRALRLEPRWVVFAGLVSAFGWASLLAYAVVAQWGNGLITHDYIRYMTSSSILLGAEFDKIVSILMVTAVLAIALQRARQVLISAARDRATAVELSRFFAQGVARKIAYAATPIEAGQGEFHAAAALVIDLRAFTAVAHKLEPDAVMDLLGQYQKRVIPKVQAYNGSIDKFLGDGILASFGAVTPTESYAADALRAADAIIDELNSWREMRLRSHLIAPRFGLGVASGRLLFGAVGDQTRLEYTVIGDAVNVAAKLEKHTKTERAVALTDAATYELAVSQGYAPPRRRHCLRSRSVEGVELPMDLVVLAE